MNEFTDKSVKFVAKSQEYYENLEQTNEKLLSLLASNGETFDQLLALKDEEIQTLTKNLKYSNERIQTLEAMLLEDGNLLSHARNIALKEERKEGNGEDTENDREEKREAVDKEKRVVIKEEMTEKATENIPKKTEVGDDNGLVFKTNNKERRGRKQQKKEKKKKQKKEERRRFSFSPCSENSKSSRGIWASRSSDGDYKVWSSQSSNQNFDFPDWRSKTSGDYGIWRDRVTEWRRQEEERKTRYQLWLREDDSCKRDADSFGEEKDQYQNEDFPASDSSVNNDDDEDNGSDEDFPSYNSSDNNDDSKSNGSDDCKDFGREDDHDDDDDNDDDNDYNYDSYVDMVYENDDFNYISDF